MSPILVRPVREQLEHDRLIRLLQGKLRRKCEPVINPGNEQNAPVGIGPAAVFPDLVLFSTERNRRVEGVVEVETGESVNHLEALAQWTHLGKLRVPFHLYVPVGMVDVARRLCEDNHITVTEIWSYHTLGDQVRFALVHRSKEVPAPKARAPKPSAPPAKPVKKAVKAPKAPKAAKVPKAVKKAPAKAKKAAPKARPATASKSKTKKPKRK